MRCKEIGDSVFWRGKWQELGLYSVSLNCPTMIYLLFIVKKFNSEEKGKKEKRSENREKAYIQWRTKLVQCLDLYFFS